jgi:hypothetical protein
LYSENVRRLLKENLGMVCPKIYVCRIRIRIRIRIQKIFLWIRIRKKSFWINNTGSYTGTGTQSSVITGPTKKDASIRIL